MARSGGSDDGSPMMEMNTTPLIDVMLCMLIIFILSIPVATHAVNIDLPTPSNVPSEVNIDPIKNKVIITRAGDLLIGGALQAHLEFERAVAAVDDMGVTVDQRGCDETALKGGGLCALVGGGQRGHGADPGDLGAWCDESGALDQAVALCIRVHRGDGGLGVDLGR